jgi:hypothetical protein
LERVHATSAFKFSDQLSHRCDVFRYFWIQDRIQLLLKWTHQRLNRFDGGCDRLRSWSLSARNSRHTLVQHLQRCSSAGLCSELANGSSNRHIADQTTAIPLVGLVVMCADSFVLACYSAMRCANSAATGGECGPGRSAAEPSRRVWLGAASGRVARRRVAGVAASMSGSGKGATAASPSAPVSSGTEVTGHRQERPGELWCQCCDRRLAGHVGRGLFG